MPAVKNRSGRPVSPDRSCDCPSTSCNCNDRCSAYTTQSRFLNVLPKVISADCMISQKAKLTLTNIYHQPLIYHVTPGGSAVMDIHPKMGYLRPRETAVVTIHVRELNRNEETSVRIFAYEIDGETGYLIQELINPSTELEGRFNTSSQNLHRKKSPGSPYLQTPRSNSQIQISAGNSSTSANVRSSVSGQGSNMVDRCYQCSKKFLNSLLPVNASARNAGNKQNDVREREEKRLICCCGRKKTEGVNGYFRWTVDDQTQHYGSCCVLYQAWASISWKKVIHGLLFILIVLTFWYYISKLSENHIQFPERQKLNRKCFSIFC